MADYKIMHYFQENLESKEFLVMQYGSKTSGWVPDPKTFDKIYANTVELAKQNKMNILLVPFYIEVNKDVKEPEKDMRRNVMGFFKKGTLAPILGVFMRKGVKDKAKLKCIKCGKEIAVVGDIQGTELTCECGAKVENPN